MARVVITGANRGIGLALVQECVKRGHEVIAACRGQVLVSGIGKSGIIGSKIAATLRSTGTAATFLHSGDALHGDVGPRVG